MTWEIRNEWCKDIGMLRIDRSIPPGGCRFATRFCGGCNGEAGACFNYKLYTAFGHAMAPKDVKNERFWHNLFSGSYIASRIAKFRGKKQTGRIRFATRGEAFSTLADIDLVASVIRENPATLFWIPTRAWNHPLFAALIDHKVRSLPNARVLASTDPTTTPSEYRALVDAGWPTMHFGEGIRDWVARFGVKSRIACPKTHASKVVGKGFCAKCDIGCFSDSRRVDVHLEEH